jgi:hypothetical protein
LGRDIGVGWNDPRIDQLAEGPEQVVVAAFVAYLGDALSPRRRQIYEQLLAVQPALRRRQMARPLTITHGDAHWGNFLFPHDPVASPARPARVAGQSRTRIPGF